MDRIVCTVDNAAGIVREEYAERLCRAAADAAGARRISADELEALLRSASSAGETIRFHVIEAEIPSAREIAIHYAVGTASEWLHHAERRFDDLHVDVMDTELNDAAIRMVADIVRRLVQ